MSEQSPAGPALLRGAAHLLRTPLTVILGISTTLRDHGHRLNPQQQTMYLGDVFQAAEEMRIALDGLSLLARLIEGGLTFAPAPTRLGALMRLSAEAANAVWGANTVAVGGGAATTVVVDPERARQAVEALARGCAPAAGVTLAADPAGSPILRLGPVTPALGGDQVRAALEAPRDVLDLHGIVAQPGGWALLVARLLLEAQGARLALAPPADAPAQADAGAKGLGPVGGRVGRARPMVLELQLPAAP